ncbi:PBECR4 domain-containing protein, partial [Ligilactobacillus salitolerans]|uniref:PBECR4 domain-containing protein n=1 Tax=Ligilactobacillus salitolerans TaxID=1808352 RepID=UPI000F607828
MRAEHGYLQILGFSDIDYQSILNDYRKNFHGNAIEIETNYKLLGKFKVVFNERDLPHLMGWEKVSKSSVSSASKIIKAIDSGLFTLQNTRSHSNFNKIKKRMLHYNFLYDVFVEQNVNVCVMTSDMKPNRLKLDIVFYQELKHEAVILGLRKDKNMSVFVPTTLHTEKLNNQYHYRR